MSKLAPNLQWFHLQSVGRHRTKAMAAELRALLAIAKAARSVLKVDGDGSNTEVPTDYWGALKALRLADARLARASSPKGRT
jgi:hypothetical protein